MSDGDIHTVLDFIPFEKENTLHVILTGLSAPHYPRPPFLWAWKLEKDGFLPASFFNNTPVETDSYIIIDAIDFIHSINKPKWIIHTDGSFLFVEKRIRSWENESWLSDLAVDYTIQEEDKTVRFISYYQDGTEDACIQFPL